MGGLYIGNEELTGNSYVNSAMYALYGFLDSEVNSRDCLLSPNINNEIDTNTWFSSYISINPYSENIDVAIDFIKIWGEFKKTKHPNSHVLFPIYKDILTYENNSLGLTPPPNIDQDSLDYIGELYQDQTLIYSYNIFHDIEPILKQIYKEEISIDIGIVEMQEIMDLYSEEYTLD